MCYKRFEMDKVGIRELRNDASAIVRRARSGGRIVVTVDGLPVAQIGPLDQLGAERTLDALVAAGQVLQPRSKQPVQPAAPIHVAGGRTTTEILREQRDR
jgi:prevent-host-death family protein